MTARFPSMLYRVKCIIAERLNVDVIIDTSFLNLHVVLIFCTEQRIRFRRREVTIVK